MNKLRTQPVVLAIDAFIEYVMTSWFAVASLTYHVDRHVYNKYPGVRVFHEDRDDIPHGAEVWQPGALLSHHFLQRHTEIHLGSTDKIDLVVTLGGDGTILHASSLFSAGATPPILSFSMGTLGFLLPFRKLVYTSSSRSRSI